MNDSTHLPREHRIAAVLTWLSVGALALAGLYTGSNPDTFGHLAQGRQIVELGHVPALDTWSLLPGPARPWHNYEWLSDLLFYGLYAGFGYDGILVFKCILLGITGIVLLRFARRLGGDRAVTLSALVLISTLPVARMRFSDRPHMLGICLAAFYFVMLSRLIDCAASEKALRRKLLAGMFVMHVLWVNLHGSHLLGVAITCAFCALSPREARKSVFSVLALQAVASCVSPYGPYIVTDAIEHVFDPRYRGLVTEWMPWGEDDPPWLQLGPALQAALLTLVGPRLARLGPSARAGLAVALLMAAASFRSIRFVAEFMLLSAPLLGAGYALMFEGWSTRTWMTRVSLALVVLCVIVPWGAARLPPYVGIGHGMTYHERPHGPGMLLDELGKDARVFGSVETNWYLMWEAPRARFIIDGRVPFYGPDFVSSVVTAFHEPDALRHSLRDYDINAVVLKHTIQRDQLIAKELMASPNWSLALIDDAFALFVRNDVVQTHALPILTALRPSYESDWILRAPPERLRAIEDELVRLANLPTAQGFRAWELALMELAPLRLSGEAIGLRWPANAEEQGRYERAHQYLMESAVAVGDVPVVSSTQALVAAILCELPSAERALERAELFAPAPGREAVLARQEIALREGRTEEVATFARAALSLPDGRDDSAIAQLMQGVESPPSCGAPAH